jgi:HEAT repeat protein
MKTHKVLLLSFGALLALSLFLLVPLIDPDRCTAHTQYTPPPPPPPPPSSPSPSFGGGGSPGGSSTPGSPGASGPSTPGFIPGGSTGGGGPSRPGGRGAFTRKARPAATATNTWEIWWARNRYEFLKFPNSGDDTRFTFTPSIRSSGNPSVRTSGTIPAGMTQLRNRSVGVIRRFLRDDSAQVRRAAMLSLGRLNDEVSFPRTLEMLKDGNQDVRYAAVLALGLSQGGKARYALLNLAKGTAYAEKLVGKAAIPPGMQSFAGVALALAKCMGGGAVLQGLADDPACDDEVRAMALEGLGLIADVESVRFLISFSRNPKTDYRLVSTAVTALGKAGNPLALSRLMECLSAKEMAVRQSAALSLGTVAPRGDAAIVNKLFRCFSRTTDRCLKGFSLLSIGRIGGYEATKKLKLVLKRGTSADLPWAALGLGIACYNDRNEEVPRSILEKLVRNHNRSTQGALAIALGLARHVDAIPRLEKMLAEGDDPYCRGYCAMALGMIGDPSVVPALREALAEKNLPQVSTQAAIALCLLNDRDSVDELTDMLFHSNSKGVKAIATRGLVVMGDVNVVETLLDFITTKRSDEDTYMFVIDLISKLIVGQKVPYLDRIAAGSNHTAEFPIVEKLLEFGI